MRDRVAASLAWGSAIVVSAVFFWILGDLLWKGLPHLSFSFWLEDVQHAGRSGGIAPILVSTAGILLICGAVSVPLSLGTAIYLAEFVPTQSPVGALVRRSLDVLAGVPSIVFGLFGNALFCQALGMGFSLSAGGLTLACMVLPILTRSVEEGLRGVPDTYREGAAALGMSKTTMLLHLLLPAAAPALVAGMILGIGRAIAETAALLFTSGYVDRMPESFGDSGRALSIHIYDLSMNVAGGEIGRAHV